VRSWRGEGGGPGDMAWAIMWEMAGGGWGRTTGEGRCTRGRDTRGVPATLGDGYTEEAPPTVADTGGIGG